jgi:hypothetical protein
MNKPIANNLLFANMINPPFFFVALEIRTALK